MTMEFTDCITGYTTTQLLAPENKQYLQSAYGQAISEAILKGYMPSLQDEAYTVIHIFFYDAVTLIRIPGTSGQMQEDPHLLSHS